jgi:hypothetical protein
MARDRTLTRSELTAALAARQGLIERWHTTPAEAIKRLTPLQAQAPRAPFVALAARLHDFTRADLERALDRRAVVKTTINRLTLHLAAAEDYPAYAQLTRQARMRAWRKTYAHLDEEQVTRDLTHFFRTPRTNQAIRERVRRYDGVTHDPWTSVIFARTLLPLVQLPPAGHWNDPRRAEFVVDPRPLPEAAEAAKHVLQRYLAAFGPASKRDIASWAGVAQRDFDFDALPLQRYRDERGTVLYDLPDAPLPPATTTLPPRFLAGWDQPLLAYKDRDRILPPELKPLELTISGAQTLTVGGRVAATWECVDGRIAVTPHTDFDLEAVQEEADRTARLFM